MFSFSDSTEYKVFVLENLLCAKLLYDRGFDVSGIRSLSDSMLPQFLDILFGDGNVEWEFFEPVPPSCLEGLTEDDDEFYWITSFLQRDHAMISIKIPLLEELDGKLRPKHYRELEQIVKKLVPGKLEEPWDFEEIWWYIFINFRWQEQNGKKTGLLLHFADIDSGWEEPYQAGWIYKTFLSFWDRLQALKSEVSKNARIHKRGNPPGRYRLVDGAEKIRGKRKAGGPPVATETDRKVA
ncbi:MAG: hypothetical protein K6T65_05580 [Peptococcaceae bacterium]|nr:hypothetical protein [Peptococcaceae bacterium]